MNGRGEQTVTQDANAVHCPRVVAKRFVPQRVRVWLRKRQASVSQLRSEREKRQAILGGLRKNERAEAPSPSAESLTAIDDVAKKIAPDFPELTPWFRDYYWGQRQRLAFDVDYVREFMRPTDKILEFGTTPLLLTGAVRRLGYDIHGVDVRPERFENAAAMLEVPITQCDIECEKLPFDDESFDGILFNEIFEHMRINLIFTFSEIRRVLRPGGTMLMSTPHLACLQGILNFVLRGRASGNSGDLYTEYEKLTKIGHMGHVREYTVYEICEFLHRMGFRARGLIYRGQYQEHWKGLLSRIFPALRPFVSYIVTR
jgi:SAM-dependent methyltransferase